MVPSPIQWSSLFILSNPEHSSRCSRHDRHQPEFHPWIYRARTPIAIAPTRLRLVSFNELRGPLSVSFNGGLKSGYALPTIGCHFTMPPRACTMIRPLFLALVSNALLLSHPHMTLRWYPSHHSTLVFEFTWQNRNKSNTSNSQLELLWDSSVTIDDRTHTCRG
nr:hypothetical protein [Tanacetum cinerariifolium]